MAERRERSPSKFGTTGRSVAGRVRQVLLSEDRERHRRVR
nr:unnamed protein product [Callosobruchus analis]